MIAANPTIEETEIIRLPVEEQLAFYQLLVAGFEADRIGLQGPGIADFGAIA